MIILIIILSLIASCMYRAGGLGQDQKYWIPKWARHSWVRDWLIPFCVYIPLFIIHPSAWFLLAFGLLGGALTTYLDSIPINKGKDNFWMAGFLCGLSAFPLLFCGFAWNLLLIRCFFIAISWGAWCAIFKNDHVEEHGRGFFVSIASIILLF